jgi:hypothetical protein
VIHPVPLPRSRTPAESTIPRLFVGLVDAAPASRTAKASACQLFRGYRAASAPAADASRMVLPPPMQSSLPAGWLAVTGRASNPLDHNKRFQIAHPPFLDLSWRYRDELSASHLPSLRRVVGKPTVVRAREPEPRRLLVTLRSLRSGTVKRLLSEIKQTRPRNLGQRGSSPTSAKNRSP